MRHGLCDEAVAHARTEESARRVLLPHGEFYGATDDAPEFEEPAAVESPTTRFCLSPGKATLTSERPSPFCASTTSQPVFDFSRSSTLTVARARIVVLSLMLTSPVL